jgi:hypothetical protein
MDEALKLEKALSRLRTPSIIAIMHYSPVQSTVEGEPPVIYPFLGCTRLEEPLNRFSVTAAFHGHAHRGAAEGRTSAGVPVYNVSLPLLRRTYPEQLPVRRLEVARDAVRDDRMGGAAGAGPATPGVMQGVVQSSGGG